MTPAKKITKKPSSAKATEGKKVVQATELPVFSMQGVHVSTIALPAELFSAPWRADLVHQVSTAMQANARQNRAHTKDRAEVSGGGKKPWKQKGTGQARHGSSRSPLWRHGGITFGPRNERDYSEKINRKMRVAALVAVLSRKAKDGEIILVDKISFAKPRTSEAIAMIASLAKVTNAERLANKKTNAALIALARYEANTIKSFRNLGNMQTEEARNLNVVDMLAKKYLIIESPEETFKMLIARIGSTSSLQASSRQVNK